MTTTHGRTEEPINRPTGGYSSVGNGMEVFRYTRTTANYDSIGEVGFGDEEEMLREYGDLGLYNASTKTDDVISSDDDDEIVDEEAELLAEKKKEKQLFEMFSMFDDDGSGEIELKEIIGKLADVGMNTAKNRDRLHRQFKFMDKDGSGEVTFKEFMAATIGSSNSDFSSLNEEHEAAEIGVELFAFLTLFRRKQIQNKMDSGELTPRSHFAELRKLARVALFPVEMGMRSPGEVARHHRMQDNKKKKKRRKSSLAVHSSSNGNLDDSTAPKGPTSPIKEHRLAVGERMQQQQQQSDKAKADTKRAQLRRRLQQKRSGNRRRQDRRQAFQRHCDMARVDVIKGLRESSTDGGRGVHPQDQVAAAAAAASGAERTAAAAAAAARARARARGRAKARARVMRPPRPPPRWRQAGASSSGAGSGAGHSFEQDQADREARGGRVATPDTPNISLEDEGGDMASLSIRGRVASPLAGTRESGGGRSAEAEEGVEGEVGGGETTGGGGEEGGEAEKQAAEDGGAGGGGERRKSLEGQTEKGDASRKAGTGAPSRPQLKRIGSKRRVGVKPTGQGLGMGRGQASLMGKDMHEDRRERMSFWRQDDALWKDWERTWKLEKPVDIEVRLGEERKRQELLNAKGLYSEMEQQVAQSRRQLDAFLQATGSGTGSGSEPNSLFSPTTLGGAPREGEGDGRAGAGAGAGTGAGAGAGAQTGVAARAGRGKGSGLGMTSRTPTATGVSRAGSRLSSPVVRGGGPSYMMGEPWGDDEDPMIQLPALKPPAAGSPKTRVPSPHTLSPSISTPGFSRHHLPWSPSSSKLGSHPASPAGLMAAGSVGLPSPMLGATSPLFPSTPSPNGGVGGGYKAMLGPAGRGKKMKSPTVRRSASIGMLGTKSRDNDVVGSGLGIARRRCPFPPVVSTHNDWVKTKSGFPHSSAVMQALLADNKAKI